MTSDDGPLSPPLSTDPFRYDDSPSQAWVSPGLLRGMYLTTGILACTLGCILTPQVVLRALGEA